MKLRPLSFDQIKFVTSNDDDDDDDDDDSGGDNEHSMDDALREETPNQFGTYRWYTIQYGFFFYEIQLSIYTLDWQFSI